MVSVGVDGRELNGIGCYNQIVEGVCFMQQGTYGIALVYIKVETE